MSDRLDDKITAFVAELVDDPPPPPDIDMDGARVPVPLGSAVPRSRLRDVAVAVAAFVVVVAVIGVVALVPWSGDSDPLGPATTVPTATTAVALFDSLSGDEMVGIVDLPAEAGWVMEQGGGVHLGWCDGESLRDPVNQQPLADLSARAAVRYRNGAVGIEQVVFADDPAKVQASFGEIRQRALACIDDRAQWSPPQDGGQIIGQSELSMRPMGDARFAIWSTATVGDGRDESYIAVVLNGSRLIVVQRDGVFRPADGRNLASLGDFWSVVDAAVSRSRGVPTVTEPANYEMLTTGDLPGHSDWQVFDETSGVDGIAGWGASEHGVLAVRCDEGLTGWRLDPSPRSYDLDKPWVRLDNARFRAMYAETAVFGEALYSSAPVTVTEAFEMMETVTLGCLTSPLSAADLADLLAMRQVGGDPVTPDITVSAADEAQLLAIGPVGDDSIAVKVKWYLSPSQTVYDIFRLAIVRDGTRLLIVEEHETVRPSDAPPRVADAEFAAVVQTAANRLKP